jgi:hypothetical protein
MPRLSSTAANQSCCVACPWHVCTPLESIYSAMSVDDDRLHIKTNTAQEVRQTRHTHSAKSTYDVWCTQADALEFYTAALQQQLRELQQLQHQVRHQLPRPAAFVTFRCAAPQCLHRKLCRQPMRLLCLLTACQCITCHYWQTGCH